MHPLPADRADHRVIDEEQACRAVAALGDPELADPTLLTLLTCLGPAGPSSVYGSG